MSDKTIKRDLIRRTASATGYTLEESKAIINQFLKLLEGDLIKGNDISLYGLGSFSVAEHKAPKPDFNEDKTTTKDKIESSPKTTKVIKFKPATTLKNKLNGKEK